MVAAVALTGYRRLVEAKLEKVEQVTGKGRDDWRGCNPKRLHRYLAAALEMAELKGCVYFRAYEGIAPSGYQEKTAAAALDVAQMFAPAQNVIFVPEGFTRDARKRLHLAGKSRFGACDVWSGGFDGCSTVRLTDALAGLIGQERFNRGSRKHFPDLCHDWFKQV